jgi:hypothetical protein
MFQTINAFIKEPSPREYKYKEYKTTIVDVFFLSNVITIT